MAKITAAVAQKNAENVDRRAGACKKRNGLCGVLHQRNNERNTHNDFAERLVLCAVI